MPENFGRALFSGYDDGLRRRDAELQHESNQTTFDEQKRVLTGNETLRGYMATNPKATAEEVIGKGIEVGAVDPIKGQEALMGVASSRAKAQAAAAKLTTEQMKQAVQAMKLIVPAASWVRDQGSYDQFRQYVQTNISPQMAAQLPPQYDPNFMQQQILDATTFLDLDKRAQLGLNKDKLNETKRHNQVMEGAANTRAANTGKGKKPVVVVENGKLVYSSPEDAVGKEAPPKGTSMQSKMDELVKMGVPEAQARAMAAKTWRSGKDDDGNVTFVDSATGETLGRINVGTGKWEGPDEIKASTPTTDTPSTTPDGGKTLKGVRY